MATEAKALKLMKSSKSAKERATQYVPRIKKSLENKIIINLEEQIAKIDDEIYDLERFNLDTDLNAGNQEMSKEVCEQRFEQIINLSHKRKLKQLELDSKKEAFDKYFN